MIDPRPKCRFCHRPWVPAEGVDATTTFCGRCRELAPNYRAAIMLGQTGHSAGCVCDDCIAAYAAVIKDVEQQAVARVLKRLGDEDVRRAAAYYGFGAVRALLEKENGP